MKKTIMALALTTASSSAFALTGPGFGAIASKTLCLDAYQNENGVSFAGACDQSANNVYNKAVILENGCAEGQIALVSLKFNNKDCSTSTWCPASRQTSLSSKNRLLVYSCCEVSHASRTLLAV